MSAYIYALKSPKHTVQIIINGQKHKAGILKYSHKPFYPGIGETEPKWQILANARLARMENLWKQHGETPRYVVVESSSGFGTVLDWHSNGNKHSVSTFDDPDWGRRTVVGTLQPDYSVKPL